MCFVLQTHHNISFGKTTITRTKFIYVFIYLFICDLHRRRLKGECECPSCKGIIQNKFKHSVSFTLREFLKNQFTEKYKERYDETQSSRNKYNKLIIKLKEKEDEEKALLKKWCGIIKLKRRIIHNFELMTNPRLHRNLISWIFRWAILYFIVLCIIIPIIVPVIIKFFDSYNNFKNNMNNNNNYTSSPSSSPSSSTFSLYFLEDMFEYFGINSIPSHFSSITISPILHSIMSVLQYFGFIGSTTNTEYLPNNYITNSVLDYNEFGNIYHKNIYYKQLFQDWRSGELKSFLRRYDIANTCVERECYTDIIIKYLKESEWNKLVNNDNDFQALPIGVLREYLNHYNVDYHECYKSFWNKDYQCFAEKAASIKIINDVYYGKKKLLTSSYKARKAKNKKTNLKQKNEFQSKNKNQNQRPKHRQTSQQRRDEQGFGFHDIGNFAFNIFSGMI